MGLEDFLKGARHLAEDLDRCLTHLERIADAAEKAADAIHQIAEYERHKTL